MVEILLIKINFTRNIRGICFAKKESRSETFADDTSFFMLKDPRYLRAAVKYLDAFSKISGLKCNISKTKVIPIGNFDKTNICPEINFKWTDTFTLLGFSIDNKLVKLDTNLDRIDKKVCNLINKWRHYNLSIHGRITVAKSVLMAQYVYITTILDLDDDKLQRVQCVINNFIAFNKYDNKNKLWFTNPMLYGDIKDGGFNMIELKDFFSSIKIGWIHRYVNGIKDHWADLIDLKLNLNHENRSEILKFGSEHPNTNKIIKSEFPGISTFFCAFKRLKEAFWGHKEILDNRWENAPIFFNPNFARTIFKGIQKGKAKIIGSELLIPSNFGLSDQNFSTLTLKSLYDDNGVFLQKTKMEEKLNINVNFLNYVNLKQVLNKSILQQDGQNRNMDDIEKLEYFCKRLYELFNPKYKGSQRFRKIFKYNKYIPPSFDTEKWEKY